MFLLSAKAAFCQSDSINSYLRINFKVKNITKTINIVIIQIEQGNRYASELYALKNIPEDNSETNGDQMYDTKKESIKPKMDLFVVGNNAFRTITEAINYLSENNWDLAMIENNIFSETKLEYDNGRYFPTPIVNSKQTYIFRKKVKRL